MAKRVCLKQGEEWIVRYTSVSSDTSGTTDSSDTTGDGDKQVTVTVYIDLMQYSLTETEVAQIVERRFPNRENTTFRVRVSHVSEQSSC